MHSLSARVAEEAVSDSRPEAADTLRSDSGAAGHYTAGTWVPAGVGWPGWFEAAACCKYEVEVAAAGAGAAVAAVAALSLAQQGVGMKWMLLQEQEQGQGWGVKGPQVAQRSC